MLGTGPRRRGGRLVFSSFPGGFFTPENALAMVRFTLI